MNFSSPNISFEKTYNLLLSIFPWNRDEGNAHSFSWSQELNCGPGDVAQRQSACLALGLIPRNNKKWNPVLLFKGDYKFNQVNNWKTDG